MYSVILSSAIVGTGCYPVRVEVDVSNGLPGFDIVGMPGGEVKEAKERVRVALKNIGIMLPPKKITVNLSPANIRKTGTALDLPLAIGILTSLEYLPEKAIKNVLFVGELGLNAEVKFVNGILSTAIMARDCNMELCVVPKCNESEGRILQGIDVIGFENLKEILDFLKEEKEVRKSLYPSKINPQKYFDETEEKEDDFSDIYGQEGVKRVAEIAAAGFHHFMMIGPPGAGKSMIAKRMPSILPALSLEESLEISRIYSVKGLLSDETPIICQRPFCSPHHTVTVPAMTGGGLRVTPGILSLAHRGVLFLDEVPHFRKEVIEVLRQPLEDRKVEVNRSSGSFSFPADFMLILAMNPCPCGFYPDRNKCRCTVTEIKRYRAHISGPIQDRIDLSVTANKISYRDLEGKSTKPESSAEIRKRIEEARLVQKKRFAGTGITFNSEMGGKEIEKYCILTDNAKQLLEKAYEKMSLSARGYHKILKVSRTIADLDHSEKIDAKHISEAIGYRITEI